MWVDIILKSYVTISIWITRKCEIFFIRPYYFSEFTSKEIPLSSWHRWKGFFFQLSISNRVLKITKLVHRITYPDLSKKGNHTYSRLRHPEERFSLGLENENELTTDSHHHYTCLLNQSGRNTVLAQSYCCMWLNWGTAFPWYENKD